jgi:hypothetical protein
MTPLRERRSADNVENEPLSTTRRCGRLSRPVGNAAGIELAASRLDVG